jgi:multiple sugar transport system permease protein
MSLSPSKTPFAPGGDRWTPWLFISPWLVGFVALILYPFGATFYWSFCRYDLLEPPRWIGAANYRRLAEELISGGHFGQALWNTCYFALLSVPLSIALGVGLAVMLSWRVRGQSVYRTLVYLPSVIPVVASAILWNWLLDPQAGLVNHLLRSVGLPAPGWFNSISEVASPWAWSGGYGGVGSKDALTLMSLWGVGNFMVIYLAALGDIPEQLYEAAELDGAGRLRRFWHITLPLLTPVIFFNLIIGLIHAVQAFTQVYIVSQGQGAPSGSLLMLSLHLFLAAFKYLDMGYASAMAWTLFMVVLVVTWLLFRWSRRWVFYAGGRIG